MLPSFLRTPWTLIENSVGIWSRHHASQAAGALAFYTLFSIAPLLIIVVSVAGLFFGDAAAQGRVSAELQEYVGADAARIVEEAARRSRPETSGILPTVLGVGALIFGATTVFAQMQTSLNDLWDVKTRPSRNTIVGFLMTRLVSFGMVLAVGFLLLTSFLMSATVATVVEYAQDWVPFSAALVWILDVAVSLAIATLLFGLIFKVLPDVELSWRDARWGALLTAALFVIGQHLILLYLTRAGPASTYGAAGALVLLLMWVYYSAMIMFLGAAFQRALVQHRGKIIRPSSGAVKLRTEIVEEKAG